jgi:hypothetical protein
MTKRILENARYRTKCLGVERTAAMKHGFRIIEDLCEGPSNWMDEKGFATTADFIAHSVPTLTRWEELDINYHIAVGASVPLLLVSVFPPRRSD